MIDIIFVLILEKIVDKLLSVECYVVFIDKVYMFEIMLKNVVVYEDWIV